jgi:DNA-binding CsgD family transcriptional regulator/tetratricopeptide (TPR) repeat protein
MTAPLLERDAELDRLAGRLAAAQAGEGSVVLLSGEAGMGKTNLVRAFRRVASGRARVLVGACDDLLTPRTLGPLRDIARTGAIPGLAEALAAGDRDGVLTAVRDALAEPTVLVVEDVHWADEATLDVLRYLGRRIADLPAVLVLTYREQEAGRALLPVLGLLTGPAVHRIALRALSRAAVERWAGGRADELYRLTEGNPFFVSEVLAAPREAGIPTTIVDVVLARVHRLDAATQAALDQLAVVPSEVELPLARALLGDLTVLAEAERVGLLEVRPSAVAFRHELGRRAVESALPASLRMRLDALVLAALLDRPDPDLARVVHHAVRAGDAEAIVRYAPEAARRAARAGAQGQAAELYAQALEYPLDPATEADLREAYAWTLYDSGRTGEAVAVAEAAVALRERLDDPAALGLAVASLALWRWADLQPADEAWERAAVLLDGGPDSVARMTGLVRLGVVAVHLGREEAGLAPLRRALAMAERLGERVPLAHVYLGRARLELGDGAGLADLERGIALARAAGDHGDVMIGYVTVVALLWRAGRYAELPRYLDEGAEYGRDRDYPVHDRGREAYRHRLALRRGEWTAAEAGLREVLGTDVGILGRHVLPALALLAVRRGDEDAVDALAAAWADVERSDHLPARLATAVAALEHAWLTGAPRPPQLTDALLAEASRRGTPEEQSALAAALSRVEAPAARSHHGSITGSAPGAGSRNGSLTGSAGGMGAPFEEAAAALGSSDPAVVTAAMEVFDRLGARPAAALARRRLRELGVTVVPRGPQPATRENPAGLTARQLEILGLLTRGLTNAEIAARLVLSVRTVDHHVSAVLRKLGASTRREAAAAAAELGLTD